MKSFFKNNSFLILMLTGIVAGCITGAVWPKASLLKPLGTIFINLMFCIVVPMVFCSIASAIANMDSMKKAGKIMGVTVATFVVTGAIAAVIMFLLVLFYLYLVGFIYEGKGCIEFPAVLNLLNSLGLRLIPFLGGYLVLEFQLGLTPVTGD